MITSISPVAENYQKIRIDDYVSQARNSLKKAIVEAQVAINGYCISLCESRTRFGGIRVWFVCPKCKKRRGVLYTNPSGARVLCRLCMRLECTGTSCFLSNGL